MESKSFDNLHHRFWILFSLTYIQAFHVTTSCETQIHNTYSLNFRRRNVYFEANWIKSYTKKIIKMYDWQSYQTRFHHPAHTQSTGISGHHVIASVCSFGVSFWISLRLEEFSFYLMWKHKGQFVREHEWTDWLHVFCGLFLTQVWPWNPIWPDE